MENKLLRLTLRRRSVRKYGGEEVSDDIISEIMKVALAAPSSFGHNPVEFIVVRDKEMIKNIAYCKRMGGTQIIGADAVIVVMVRTGNKQQAEFWVEDGAIASAYILLAVEQYNLGACWVHIRNRKGKRGTSDEEIRELLDVPDSYTVLNLVAIGTKGEQKAAYREETLDYGKIHRGRF